MKWSDFDPWLKADYLQGKAQSLTIDQVVVEDVYSQAEKRLRPAPVVYFRETKKGLVLSDMNQDALQALFGDASGLRGICSQRRHMPREIALASYSPGGGERCRRRAQQDASRIPRRILLWNHAQSSRNGCATVK